MTVADAITPSQAIVNHDWWDLPLHTNGAQLPTPSQLRERCEHENIHDDIIKGKHFPRYWPFVREIHRSLVNSPYKGQWRGVWCFLWSVNE